MLSRWRTNPAPPFAMAFPFLTPIRAVPAPSSFSSRHRRGARDFEDLSRRPSPQYRVIALDLPNHGNSGPDSRPASARYTQILAQFIHKLHLPAVVLLGNSIGGAVSIRYVSQQPERVKAIVLCDRGGLGPPGPVGHIFIGVFVQFFAAGRRGAFWFPRAFDR